MDQQLLVNLRICSSESREVKIMWTKLIWLSTEMLRALL